MAKAYAVRDDGYRLSDELWAQMEPLLPPRPSHPLGCHRPPTPARQVMDAIVFVLRTGCQWNALNATSLCSSSVAHRRFQDWAEAGVFEAFWQGGLLAWDWDCPVFDTAGERLEAGWDGERSQIMVQTAP